jgi:hypothetical protein
MAEDTHGLIGYSFCASAEASPQADFNPLLFPAYLAYSCDEGR